MPGVFPVSALGADTKIRNELNVFMQETRAAMSPVFINNGHSLVMGTQINLHVLIFTFQSGYK